MSTFSASSKQMIWLAERTQAFVPVSLSTSALREDNFPNFVVEEGSIEEEEEEEEEEDDVMA